jgi:hypothetical protein
MINLILLWAVLVSGVISGCTNELSCFKSKLFNFDSPAEEYYQAVNIFTNQNSQTQYNAISFGDFNNDFRWVIF